MKKTGILVLSAVLSVLGPGCWLPLGAQTDSVSVPSAKFTVGASHWSRGEWRSGALPVENGAASAMFVMSSTSVTLDYRRPWLEVRITPKHAGVWGAAGGGSFSLDEGWVGLRHSSGLFARVGRQKLAYDDQRIIGSDDWVMACSKHDVLLAGFERPLHKLHVMAAFNQNDVNVNGGTYYIDGGQPYKSMQTVWYHIDPLPVLGASLLFMNTGMQDLVLKDEEDNVTQYQQLFGGFADFHPRNFSLQASYYRQTGHDESELAIHAWMTSAEAAWTVNSRWKLGAGYFHLSGDPYFYVPPEGAIGMARKTEVRGFNPIFGSHHPFYGAMDFFYVTTYYGGNTPGLQDFHLGVTWTPSARWDAGVKAHALATSIQFEDNSRMLGYELELTGSWQIMRDVSLQAGYTYMRGTPTMTVLKRTGEKNRLHWGWLMLSVTPEFFSY